MKKSQLKRKKKMRILAATLGVAALIAGGLTFAWYTSTDSVTNTFMADGTFKTVVVENFVPPTNWEPGTTTDKVVQVTNTGTIDAYTRVQLVPYLSFDRKIALADGSGSYQTTALGSAVDVTTESSYARVNAQTIEAAVKAWNDSHEDADDYVEYVAGTNVSAIFGTSLETVPNNVTLYVKKSTGTTNYQSGIASTDGDSARMVTVDTEKYEVLGYYTVSKAVGADADAEETVNYELAITFDNSALRAAGYDISDNDGFVKINTSDSTSGTPATNTLMSATTLALYNIEKINSVDNGLNLSDYVEINKADGYDSSWAQLGANTNIVNDWHYYKKILKSGTTTEPIIKSVKFKDDAPMADAISNLTFTLTVNEESTQAIMEAAIATFGNTDANIDTTDVTENNSYATGVIVESEQNWQSDFSSAEANAGA